MGPEAPTGWLVWCVKVLLLIIDIYIWYITPIYTNYTSSITQLCLWFKPTSWYNDNQNGWVPTSPNTPELGTTCIYPVPYLLMTVAPRTVNISNFCLEWIRYSKEKLRYIWSRWSVCRTAAAAATWSMIRNDSGSADIATTITWQQLIIVLLDLNFNLRREPCGP